MLVLYGILINFLASKFDAFQSLGWIIMAAIIILDAISYLYSSLGNVMNQFTKTIIFAGSRLCLISFGFDYWQMGFCLV